MRGLCVPYEDIHECIRVDNNLEELMKFTNNAITTLKDKMFIIDGFDDEVELEIGDIIINERDMHYSDFYVIKEEQFKERYAMLKRE